eukprot:gene2710-3906_t
MKKFVVVLLLLISTSIFAIIKVNKKGEFIDEFGRVMVFHGQNAVEKSHPFYPELEWFFKDPKKPKENNMNSEAGWNMLRLGILWEGFEPVQGKYNYTYLNELTKIVDKLGEGGIYTLLDMHQDLFSSIYCGDGAPLWVVKLLDKNVGYPAFPIPISEHGFKIDNQTRMPAKGECAKYAFQMYYFSRRVSSNFQTFYDNVNRVQDHFIMMWKTIAKHFKNHKYVLGYELINEPWGGDIFQNPKLFLNPYLGDLLNLQPLYDKLHLAIRSEDNEHIIFFEPAVNNVFETGFKHQPGGITYSDRNVLSHHWYCPVEPVGSGELVCKTGYNYYQFLKNKDVKRLKVGRFLTEFGAIDGELNNPIYIKDMDFILNGCDREIESWAYWQILHLPKVVNGEYDDRIKSLTRTYAVRIAGETKSMKYNPDTNEFNLHFLTNFDNVKNNVTEIFLNEKLNYDHQYEVNINPAESLNMIKRRNFLYFRFNQQVQNNLEIHIKITKK